MPGTAGHTGIYKRTDYHREILSIGMLGNHNFGDCKGKNNGAFGKHWKWSDKNKKKLSKIMKGNHNFQNGTGTLGKHWKNSEKSKKHYRDAQIKHLQTFKIKYKNTDIEKIVKKILKNLKQRNIINSFKQSIRIKNFIVDFLVNKNLIIECNSKWWHKGFAKKVKDMRRKEILEKLGYKVLILWDKEIYEFKKCPKDFNKILFNFI